jgi:predicted amidohydrolase
MKIALLQMNIIWENRPENISHCQAMLAALPSDVQLVVLPEMFTTGFSMHPETLAETEDGPSLTWMRNRAVHQNMALTGSLIIKEGRRYFNRLFFVFPDGSYRRYDKRHLFSMGEEHLHYAPGEERLVVEYQGWRICPLVCYDLRFPVWSRNRGEEAYDLLLYVANWPASRSNAWDTLLAARSIENQCYVAGVNRCGSDVAGHAHNGHSQVLDYKGAVVAAAAENAESSLTAVLSLEDLKAFRKKFPVGNDADNFTIIQDSKFKI